MLEMVAGRLRAEHSSDVLEDRINDESLLPFEKDRRFANDVLGWLTEMTGINPERDKAIEAAIEAFNQLVPRINRDGTRQIADRRIIPKLERLIASRYEAREVDLLGSKGVWGSVPLVVREAMQRLGNIGISLEATDKCTVMCDFCGFADKGSITCKASFESVVRITEDVFQDTKKYCDPKYIPCDAYYGGSDPFDMRWYNALSGSDLDYGDVLVKHRDICGKSRYVYTSTALPIGEELRVLRALLWFLGAKTDRTISDHSVFRISRTNVNITRTELLMTVVGAFFADDPEKFEVILTDNRSKASFLAGKHALAPTETNLGDVVGVNCRDCMMISLDGLKYATLAGTSTERPSGETKRPACVDMGDGLTEYSIPEYYYTSEVLSDDPRGFFPDVTMHKVRVDSKGRVGFRKERITNDPYRSHLRLAAIGRHYFSPRGIKKWKSGGLTRKQRTEVLSLVKKDLKIVEKHLKKLDQDGISNPLMRGTYIFWLNALD